MKSGPLRTLPARALPKASFWGICEDDLLLETERLVLEPITVGHTDEMHGLLSETALYPHIPEDPPLLAELRAKYLRWEHRQSPSGDELWLNWAARLKTTGALVAHFQAGLDRHRTATLGYIVGVAHQGRGYAFESLTAVLQFLGQRLNAQRIEARIDTRNGPSVKLAEKLGFRRTAFIEKADHFKGAPSDEYVYERAPANGDR